jgi:branched-chain amino acid transport system permease protein
MSDRMGVRLAGILAILAFLLTFPLFASLFFVLLFTEILIFSLFSLSFNLLFGYTGLLSFGHAAFFGLGGYAMALVAVHWHLSMIPALLSALVVSFLGAAIIGFFCVRRDEIYFAMLTLGFGMMVFTLVHQWRGLTGGSDGLTGFEVPVLNLVFIKFFLFSPITYYYFTLCVCLFCTLFLWRLIRSPFGLILTSMRENAERVSFIGVNVRFYRWIAFILAGVVAGMAGALFAPYDRMASPSMVHWTMSAKPVLMAILGGARVFMGPVVGAFIFFLLEHVITQYTQSWMIFLGAVLVPIVIFFPKGVLGTVMDWKRRLTRGWPDE